MDISPQRRTPGRTIWFKTARVLGIVVFATAVDRLPQVRGQEPAQEPTQQNVTFLSGDLELAGAQTLPAGPGHHPAVVTISGSGPQNRDGDNATATSGDLALDAEAAVRFLQTRPEIDLLWIGLLGHS